MLKDRRITQLLETVLAQSLSAEALLDHIVVAGIAAGLNWDDLVLAVDEAERLTGLRLHPAPAPTPTF